MPADPAHAPCVRPVDGPMLPHLHRLSPTSHSEDNPLPRGTTSLVPLLTPPPSSSDAHGSDGEEGRYLLVPSPTGIVVRSARRGRRIGELMPEKEGAEVRGVCVAWLPTGKEEEDDDEGEEEVEEDDDEGENGEWVVLAGCSDGIVREWAVADLSNGPSAPRRSFHLSCGTMQGVEVVHLTSASTDEDVCRHLSADGAVLYGLIKGVDRKSDEESTWLVRCQIPPFAPSNAAEGNISLVAKPLASTTHVSSKNYGAEAGKNARICLRRKDAIFGFVAAHRPSLRSDGGRMDYVTDDNDGDEVNAGDVFVALASSHGLAVYRDTALARHAHDIGDEMPTSPSGSLVHFATSLKASQHYTKDQAAFCSVAVSPGTKDVALGRCNGQIEILDDVFANVAMYLDGLAAKKDAIKHPEKSTVRRTVHWHAHPVRALAFLTASGGHDGGAATLLSGGEESVLAAWQLERNYHKPSTFIARVGQGGIVHALCCPNSNRIVVFCADNSIQCYGASNYERMWCEQGLASMALHAEEDEAESKDGPRKGPIVMVKDPITGHPMLTNLPGAPGMVHWYDPKSASVVGTLEVASYNRVSRRDPQTDPHIPAPAVTHMGVGSDGRDMVTVDTVWTENTSVGAAYDLDAPQGTVPMNVCTSIKFWSYAGDAKDGGGGRPDQRKRRAGDVPMHYALVSSMAAPHGRNGEVCALAVAPGGNVACTLSREEEAFRVWVKNTDTSSTLWKCLYKVKTPSGYANLLSRAEPSPLSQRLVSFSSDGTVLAVSYGPYVTLWDHASATMLTSLTLDGNGSSEDVQSVNFLTQNDDMMILTTASQVNAKSPFGGFKSRYLGGDEWSFDAGALGHEASISAVAPLHDYQCKSGPKGGCFAMSFTMDNGARSIIVVISREGGSVVCAEDTDVPLRWEVGGEVQSLCVEACAGPIVKLLAITRDSKMHSLSSMADGAKKARTASRMDVQSTRDARAQAPVLKVGSDATDAAPSLKRRKVSIGMSTGSDGASRSTTGFDFPSLSGKFTSAFIAKSFGRSSR